MYSLDTEEFSIMANAIADLANRVGLGSLASLLGVGTQDQASIKGKVVNKESASNPAPPTNPERNATNTALAAANPQAPAAKAQPSNLEKVLNVLEEVGIPKQVITTALAKLGLVSQTQVEKTVKAQVEAGVKEAMAKQQQAQAAAKQAEAQQQEAQAAAKQAEAQKPQQQTDLVAEVVKAANETLNAAPAANAQVQASPETTAQAAGKAGAASNEAAASQLLQGLLGLAG